MSRLLTIIEGIDRIAVTPLLFVHRISKVKEFEIAATALGVPRPVPGEIQADRDRAD